MVIPERKKRVTIKDVAQAAGVSTQTVSRVINKVSYVSGETRQRVEAVVDQLGYHPSTLARSLSQQRSYTLGIVTYDLKYIGPSRTLNGIADMADELGYMLLMKELDSFDDSRIFDVIDSLLSRQVDGILWAVPEINDNHNWIDERLEKISVPVLFIAMQPRKGISSVSTNNFLGGKMAVEHLLSIGKRRIGHVSGPNGWWEADERKRGWMEALRSAGIEASDNQCVEGNWSSSSGEQAFTKLLQTYPEMDAVFAANDQMGLSILREAFRRNIKIPDELAVIGFDGIPESAYFYPSLTTISQNLQLLGEQSVRDIVEMIQSRQNNISIAAQSKFIHPALIIRESTVRHE